MVSSRILRGGRVVLLALLLASCSTRDHSNPFDPENPDTRGRPRLLSAVAGNGRVDLGWTVDPLEDLAGFRLRRTGPAGTTVLAESLGAAVRAWSDTTVVNESSYDYRLDVRFEGQPEFVETPAVTATPGRRSIWLLDGRSGGPLRIAPDGRAVVARVGEYAPGRLDVEAGSGTAYVVDVNAARVEAFAAGGARLAGVEVPGVLALASRGDGAGVWLAARNPGRILQLSSDLATVNLADTLEGQFQELAWDGARGALWASDVEGLQVLHRRADGRVVRIDGFEFPFALAIDPPSGDAWVADRRNGSVSRIDAEADTILFRVGGFRSPLDIVVDPGGAGVWVSDGTLGLVVLLDAAGLEIRRITGFGRPFGLAPDPDRAALWVTDAQRGTLERFDLAGVRQERLTGLFSPYAIGVVLPTAVSAPRRP